MRSYIYSEISLKILVQKDFKCPILKTVIFYFYGNLFFEYDNFDFNVFLPCSIIKVCNK